MERICFDSILGMSSGNYKLWCQTKKNVVAVY